MMTPAVRLNPFVCLLLSCALPCAAQTYQPKANQFKSNLHPAEAELVARSGEATLATTPSSGLTLNNVTAIGYLTADTPVLVGAIHVEGAPRNLADPAGAVAGKLTGSSYDAQGSISLVETDLSDFCKKYGYLQAVVHAHALPDPVTDSKGLHIAIAASIEPGPQYKLEAIVLSPDLLVTQADFDKQSILRKGQLVTPEKLQTEWTILGWQYHNRGYMQAKVEATPTYQNEQATVSYAVTVESGPVYTMGTFTVEDADDETRTSLAKAWKLQPGAVFNESALSELVSGSFSAAVRRFPAGYMLRHSLALDDDAHTVDVIVRLVGPRK